jgi:hypothetical protein
MHSGSALLRYYPEVPGRTEPDSQGLLLWIRDSFRASGFFGGLRFYAQAAIELLRDLTPSRRKSRYGDIDFDFDHGVDTTWATVPLRTRMREWLLGVQYQASEPELFRQIIEALPEPPAGFTFIDLGSGKGRTLLMASGYAFRRIIGIELLTELNAVAVENIARYKSDQQKCFALESRAGDARQFVFPAEPLVLYLFNPFPEYVLRKVLQNLECSLREHPRTAYVIYHNLVHLDVFQEQPWLREITRTHQYAIYKASNT